MSYLLNKIKLFTLHCLLIFCWQINGHGFAGETLVSLTNYTQEPVTKHYSNLSCWQTISQVYANHIDYLQAKSYDPQTLIPSHQKINLVGTSTTNCYYRISFNNCELHDIICTPAQEFYLLASLPDHTPDPNLITKDGWRQACTLQPGDILLCDRHTTLATKIKYPGIAITDI